MSNDNHPIKYCLSVAPQTDKTGFFVKGANHDATWADFIMLLQPIRTKETLREFDHNKKNNIKVERGKLAGWEKTRVAKASGGWMVGYHARSHPKKPFDWEGPYRSRNLIHDCSIILLDFDRGDALWYDRLRRGKILPWLEYYVISTRSDREKKPRCRIAIPLKEIIEEPERFYALVEIFAQMFDPDLSHFDANAANAPQLMFRTTISSDQQHWDYHNEGELLDGEAVLADWLTNNGFDDIPFNDLPVAKKTGKHRRQQSGTKGVHPREKKGVVGTFCRAHSITEAVAKWELPYDSPVANGRCHYDGASGNEAVEIVDDTWLSSWHARDPVGKEESRVNAFDLVRLHKYGHLDTDHGDDPTQWPSYKAMVKDLEKDEDFKRQRRIDQRPMLDRVPDVEQKDIDRHTGADTAALEKAEAIRELIGGDEFFAAEKRVQLPDYDKDWQDKLEATEKGFVIPGHAFNMFHILRWDYRLFGKIAYNEITKKPVVTKPIDVPTGYTIAPNWDHAPISDDNMRQLKTVFTHRQEEEGFAWPSVPEGAFVDAVTQVAQLAEYHPVRQLIWKMQREAEAPPDDLIENFFPDIFGAPPTPLWHRLGEIFWGTYYDRIMRPGERTDYAWALISNEHGMNKTEICRILGFYDFYCEFAGDLSDTQKFMEQTEGKIIVEYGEGVSMRKTSQDVLKSHLTSQIDRSRAAYGRQVREIPRAHLPIITSNNTYMLMDRDNRRIIPAVIFRKARIDLLKARFGQYLRQIGERFEIRYRAKFGTGDLPASRNQSMDYYIADHDPLYPELRALQSSILKTSDVGLAAERVEHELSKGLPLGWFMSVALSNQSTPADDPTVLPMVINEHVVAAIIERKHIAIPAKASAQTVMSEMKSWRPLGQWNGTGGDNQMRLFGRKCRPLIHHTASDEERLRGYRLPGSEIDVSDLI